MQSIAQKQVIFLLTALFFISLNCQKIEDLYNRVMPDDSENPSQPAPKIAGDELLANIRSENPLIRREAIIAARDGEYLDSVDRLKEVILREDTLKPDKLLAAEALVTILKKDMDWEFGLRCLFSDLSELKETGLIILSHMTHEDMKKYNDTEFFNLFRSETERILKDVEDYNLQKRALNILKQMQQPFTVQLLLEIAVTNKTLIADLSLAIAKIMKTTGFIMVREFDEYQDIPQDHPLYALLEDSLQFQRYKSWLNRTVELVKENINFVQSGHSRQKLFQALQLLTEGEIEDIEMLNLFADLTSSDITTSFNAQISLKEYHSERVFPYVVKLLDEEEHTRKLLGIKLLGEIGDSLAIAYLQPFVKDFISKNRGWRKNYTEKDKELAQMSLLALGNLKHESAIPVIKEALADDILCTYALRGLSNIPIPVEIDVNQILRFIDDNEITYFFKVLASTDNIDVIKEQLNHSSGIRRIYAGYYLAKELGRDAISLLDARISQESEDNSTQKKVREALIAIKNQISTR